MGEKMDRERDLAAAITRARVRDCLHLRSLVKGWTTKRIIAQLFVDDWNLSKHILKQTDDSKAYHAYLAERCDILAAELTSRGVRDPYSADLF